MAGRPGGVGGGCPMHPCAGKGRGPSTRPPPRCGFSNVSTAPGKRGRSRKLHVKCPGHRGTGESIRREGTSEASPEAVRQAVGGGCRRDWGRLLSVINAIESGTLDLPSGPPEHRPTWPLPCTTKSARTSCAPQHLVRRAREGDHQQTPCNRPPLFDRQPLAGEHRQTKSLDVFVNQMQIFFGGGGGTKVF